MPQAVIEDGKVDLDVNFYDFTPSAEELGHWEAAFNRASLILYHATAGQLQLGQLSVSSEASGIEFNASILEHNGTSYGGFRLNIAICNQNKNSPLVIVHELGHYLFELGDEYHRESGSATYGICQTNSTEQACIMQFTGLGDVLSNGRLQELGAIDEFCSDNETGSHAPGLPKNVQEVRHGESCWDTIMNKASSIYEIELERPASARPRSSAGHQDIEWIEMEGRGWGLLVDTAAGNSVSRAAQMTGVMFWLDYFKITQNPLTLVDSTGNVLVPFQKLDDNSFSGEAIRDLVDSLPSNLPSDIQLGLDQVVQQITDNSTSRKYQDVVLVSLGELNNIPNQDKAKEIRRSNARIRVLELSQDGQNDMRLEAFAKKTHGDISRFKGEVDQASSAFALQNRLIELGLSNDANTTAIKTKRRTFAPSVQQNLKLDGPVQDAIPHEHPEQPMEEIILIEPGCADATFVLSQNRATKFDLDLVTPQGEVVDVREGNAVERGLYQIKRVLKPEPGVWRMRIRPLEEIAARTETKSFVYAQNPSLRPEVLLHVTDDGRLEIQAHVFYRSGLLENLDVTAEIFPAKLWEKSGGDDSIEGLVQPDKFSIAGTDVTYAIDREIYRKRVEIRNPGLYTVVVRFVNAGLAQSKCVCCDEESEDELISPFIREITRQIRID